MFIDIIDLDKLKLYDQEDKDKELIDKEARRVKFRLLGPLS